MIFPNRLPENYRIVEVSPIFCVHTDAKIGTRYRETGIAHKSGSLARKIADRMSCEAYDNHQDCFYAAIPMDKPATYRAPAPKFYAPDVETSDDCPW